MALKASFNRIGFLGRNYTLQRLYSSAVSSNEKIYELRTYVVNPRDQRQFLDLSKEWMHLRTAHSKLIGYWTNELGSGINDMVHIWEYDSLKHRADVRQRLAGDPEWVGSYFSKILPWLQRQENDLLRCLPGTEVKDAPGSGIYELQNVTFPPDPAISSQLVQNLNRPGSTLLGSWYCAFSKQYIGWLLWHHNDLDNAAANPLKTDEASKFYVVQSKVLLPTPWSPLK
ncbi:protein NipSnap homolog 3A-like isoform X2 [Mya arenaria]|uniref:protein NipSnap homolog 3A-like isoform X2 n=1 Tax=Mya arenaria TaxID=6604 RepID=UPI0022E96BCC|nr:protein NipSnap homolog 3A-like isoform X2 [Mya arenaria]